jgi:hypothetical protein
MKRNAYEDSTIKKVAKLLRHLNGKLLYVKQLLGHKDTRSTEKYITEDEQIEWLPIKCITDEQIQQAIKDDCILVGHENGTWYFKKPV